MKKIILLAIIFSSNLGFAQTAYVSNSANTVSVVNVATNSLITTIDVGSGPESVSLSADRTRFYVANRGSNLVSVINTATNTVIATIPVGISPAGIAVIPDGSKVYVSNSGNDSGNTVTVINTSTN